MTDPVRAADEATLSEAGLEVLLTEVLDRVQTARDEQVHWRLLTDAVVTMAADLSLDELLTRIVQIAADLAGAAYAALGVLGPEPRGRRRLRTFITYGLSEEQVRRIGELPEGHGLLGRIIDRPEPLRLHDLAMSGHSSGFPAAHPGMHSFLGVPVRTKGSVFGNLYLTEKIGGGDFTEHDESIVVALAAAAGVAIENARLHEDAARRQRWLSAANDVTTALMSELNEPDVPADDLQLIADRARAAADADVAWIVTGPDAEHLRLQVASGIEIDPSKAETVDADFAIAGSVARTGAATVVEDIANDERASAFGVLPIERLGLVMMLPLRGVDSAGHVENEGVLALAWEHERADVALDLPVELPASFAKQAALAIRVARSRHDREQLALYADRDRIGRDLHDLVIQRLFAIGLNLQSALRWTGDPRAAERLDERLNSSVDEIDETIRDIRRTIFELGALAKGGTDLQTEVTALVKRAASSLKVRPSLAFEGPVRSLVGAELVPDVLAVLSETLSNAGRHAQATDIAVRIRAADELTLTVRDNGRGIPADAVESGLSNIRERAERHHGACVIARAEPSGTIIEWSVPLRQA
ncbi:GAF domain-containing sensor histidine kinase [Nocardioides nematodiphilus]|uniref:GAF domain-containing sensor histidine kinase n=1 Tax=Nocardioides nematodiphilus TaxID=2849669 RepID=UPI001CDA34BF|nr:GAF domain-containing protein [Nocardioides nematodiphilus]MCA1984761.1 GAF domain-containing protein [Nocardioides nematodiphilus]